MDKIAYFNAIANHMESFDENMWMTDQITPDKDTDMDSCVADLPSNKVNSSVMEDGFPSKFVHHPTETGRYDCAICLDLPRRPLMILTCGHCICEHHLMESWKYRRSRRLCGVCRKSYTISNLCRYKVWDIYKPDEFKKIMVTCPEGCGYEAAAGHVDLHQHYDCPRRPLNCPCFGCGETMLAQDLEFHYDVCMFRTSPQLFKAPVFRNDNNYEAWRMTEEVRLRSKLWQQKQVSNGPAANTRSHDTH